MRVGSTGAGVNIEPGVTTSVFVKKASKPKILIRLNGRALRNPIVSWKVVHEYLALVGRSWSIQIDHNCTLPVGAGYGTSGGGAASLSLALNEALQTNLSRESALAIAHIADASARAGLGTVASVSEGGFVVRMKPGAPGLGVVRSFTVSGSARVVSGSFGPISTKRVLSSIILTRRVNACSKGLVGRLIRKPDEKNFVRLSRRFAECLGLASSRLQRVLASADRLGVAASMMMLGEGIFCISRKDAVPAASRLFHQNGLFPVVSRVCREGAHVI